MEIELFNLDSGITPIAYLDGNEACDVGMVCFQVTTLPDEFPDAHFVINDLRLEYVIVVEGVVWSRPSESISKKRKTGMIEVAVEHVQVLNAVRSKLPFLVTISDMELMKNKFVMLPREDALLDGSDVA
ncbi:hypothetical protein Vadar_002925 [Vaccinium darrowii]|uniref:Uncharacterized protein n=1 Tax=Vaccinium darrowii TaxID=229202 RepID=A0ACB7YCR6_9ERIC|nr:hypothetical protein Vadar_002925 [Vaccinium darrowii]